MDIDHALAAIDRAVDRSYKLAGATDDVIEALRFLNGRVERETLVWFYKSLLGENQIGRTQNTNAARNRIRYLLGYLPL